MPTDVLDFEQLASLVEATMARFGRIDILVNNAGWFSAQADAANFSAREFEAAMRFNVTTAFELSRLMCPLSG